MLKIKRGLSRRQKRRYIAKEVSNIFEGCSETKIPKSATLESGSIDYVSSSVVSSMEPQLYVPAIAQSSCSSSTLINQSSYQQPVAYFLNDQLGEKLPVELESASETGYDLSCELSSLSSDLDESTKEGEGKNQGVNHLT